ncbi:hypothetical protein Tco_0327528 [Tanacetum coccineum]
MLQPQNRPYAQLVPARSTIDDHRALHRRLLHTEVGKDNAARIEALTWLAASSSPRDTKVPDPSSDEDEIIP